MAKDWDLRNGCPNCGKKDFEETINKGIVQKIIYKNGYIAEETTIFPENRGKIKCLNCDFKTNEEDGYEL